MMKGLFFWLLVATSIDNCHAIDKDTIAPVFDLRGQQGQVKLVDYKGKVVYLDFWASWCGPCRKSFPWMNEMQAKYAAHGLQIIAVNVDAKMEDANLFLTVTPAHFLIGFDPTGNTPRNYAIKGMPTSILIGVDGKIIFQHAGFKDDDKNALEIKIEQALGLKK